MDAVILFSHGSLLCGAGEALDAHAARLRAQGLAPIVDVGYLNYSEPPFLETVANCVEKGADRILVTPYFLVSGYFVNVGMRKAVEAAREAFPKITFVTAEAIGFDTALADALIEAARCASPPSEWHRDLARAVARCRANPECPLYKTCMTRPVTPSPPSPPLPGFPSKPLHEAGASAARSVGGRGGEMELAPCSPPKNGGRGGAKGLGESEATALLVMVHGSPQPVANEEMARVVDVVRQRGVFPIVEIGFLECNEPRISNAIELCVARGATQILAAPYFLHTGTHVAEDLPALLEEGRQRHPDIEFRMGDYLGRSEGLTAVLAERTRAIL